MELTLIRKQSTIFVFAFVFFSLLIVIIACSSSMQNNEQVARTTPGSGSSTDSPNVTLKKTIAPSPVAVTRDQLTQPKTEQASALYPTSQSSLVSEITDEPGITTPNSEAHKISGKLFLYEPTGIRQITLANGEQEYLLLEEESWIDWGAHFAQNKEYLAYWVKTVNGTELWGTKLPEWQPKLLLEVDDTDYDFATPLWGVNDRYLLFVLAVRDLSGPLEDIKIIRTYIIDEGTGEVVSQPYWPGDCSILAPSPQTGNVSQWCLNIQDNDDLLHEYLVLEPEESPWITRQEPDPLKSDCYFSKCAWSKDGASVAYSTDGYPNELFYTSVENLNPLRLDDKMTDTFSFIAWSPDRQFLSYYGACASGDIQCPNILSVNEQRTVWRADENSNRGPMGVVSVGNLIWSPDSQHIATPILSDGLKILIFDVEEQKEFSRIDVLGRAVLDLLWTSN